MANKAIPRPKTANSERKIPLVPKKLAELVKLAAIKSAAMRECSTDFCPKVAAQKKLNVASTREGKNKLPEMRTLQLSPKK